MVEEVQSPEALAVEAAVRRCLAWVEAGVLRCSASAAEVELIAPA